MDKTDFTKSFSQEIIEDISILKKRKEHALQQLATFRFRWWGWGLSSLLGGVIYYAIFPYEYSYSHNLPIYIGKLLLGCLYGAFAYAYLFGAFLFMNSSKLRRIEIELAKAGVNELQENINENFFTKLVQINFKYLDQYYLQTQEQADKSFRLSSFASISGLVIILVGIIMMYSGKTTPAYVTTTSGILSEFIAAIFFYLYNRTILKMSQYHQKLVLTQNINLALKITDEMEREQKAKSLELLIERLTIDVNKYLADIKD